MIALIVTEEIKQKNTQPNPEEKDGTFDRWWEPIEPYNP